MAQTKTSPKSKSSQKPKAKTPRKKRRAAQLSSRHLLGLEGMPAQDIHILKSFADVSPWYRCRSGGMLRTPEWEFDYEDLRRFPRTDCESGGSGALD